MRTYRLAAAVMGAAIVLSACSGPGPAKPQPSKPSVVASSAAPAVGSDALLVVGRQGTDSLDVIVAGTSERIETLPFGAPDARWSRLLTASRSGKQTIVRDAGLSTGESNAVAIDGAWRLPRFATDALPIGVSAGRSTVVLVEDNSARADATRFAVLHAPFTKAARVLEVAGAFTYDAVSPDGATIYVIEHLAGPPDGHYQVRAIDVASGLLKEGVIVDKRNVGEEMAGWPLAQLRQDNGLVLTLYRGHEHPFIHALDTAQGFAVCIDLPASGADDADAALDWGLATSPDGGTVYAANATLGLVVDVDPAELLVRRSAQLKGVQSTAIALAKVGHQDGGPVARRVIVAPDGRTIYAAGSGGILAIGLPALAERGRFLEGQRVDALGATSDGRTLFALLRAGGRIVELDARTGAVVSSVPGGGYDRLLAVGQG